MGRRRRPAREHDVERLIAVGHERAHDRLGAGVRHLQPMRQAIALDLDVERHAPERAPVERDGGAGLPSTCKRIRDATGGDIVALAAATLGAATAGAAATGATATGAATTGAAATGAAATGAAATGAAGACR